METPVVDMEDMYEFVAKKLASSTTISELTVFIEKLLTFKQLQYDLLALLDHYYQVANNQQNKKKVNRVSPHMFGDSQGESESESEPENNNNNFSSSTETLRHMASNGTTTETITKTCIYMEEFSDGYSRIRSLYFSLAPLNEILSTDLCTKIISYVPGREYAYKISLVCKYFNYLIFYDKTAKIYNESSYNICILDNIDLYKKYQYLLLIINFENGLIEFIPPNNGIINKSNNRNIYIKKITDIKDIREIPYFGIKEWTLSILSDTQNTHTRKLKPKQLSLTNKHFESELGLCLQGESKQQEKDLILSIIDRSCKGIYKLTLISCDAIHRIQNCYPTFVNCIILCIDKCIFLDNPYLCLSCNRFPNLQYFELINISFSLANNYQHYKQIYEKLIQHDPVYMEYNKNKKGKTNTRYDLLINKILKVYKIIANNLLEWKIINDILCHIGSSDGNGSLLSFKCTMKKSGFIQMVGLLLKCVQQRNENIDINALRIELLNTLNITLLIPASIEWLFLSNIDCKINLFQCKKLMAAQLNNIPIKQIIFPKQHVIPCFALCINQHQIFKNWIIGTQPPPVRFIFFNGSLKPNNINSNRCNNILNVISVLKEKYQRNTNRDKKYLSIYLNNYDRKHLFAKLITFSLNFDINKMNKKIQIYKVWWNHHNVANWIKDFGQDI